MSKTMSLMAAIIAIALASGTGSAAARGAALGQTLLEDGNVITVAEKKSRKAKRRDDISPEHKQRIRENVPAEYHQYLPKSITGGGAGGGTR